MEIVSRYDPETMTAESREEMRSELQEAGIGRGKDLGDIMVDQGFEVKRPSGKGPGGPPPPQGGSEEDEEIAAFVEKYESGELSSEDIAALMELLRDRGESGSGVLMDEQA
ncbi:hypothetical protein [Pelagicoccus sp. SDUM812005]|uniref:hypothetical protein n=1 Tax=Pelagicoccus sp. SDUM812005 TaxID=3041257 RepID=UPI0028125B91|nr:hypothetical protein [Pelagicoccus sp. SDUM812005]